MAAAKRISQMLCDKERYMNGQLEPVEVTFKVQRAHKPKGRLEVFRKLTLLAEQPGQRVWQLCKNGVKCRDCSKHIKGPGVQRTQRLPTSRTHLAVGKSRRPWSS